MKTFLEWVAEDLYNKIGNDLSTVRIVFPNKRAGLFFNDHLAGQSEQPIWAPACLSISELFRQFSKLKVGDPIGLICQLYTIFREETQSTETLDDFFFWGELLINDFDDVDKNLVNADQLFDNLSALRELADTPDFLDQEQEEAIRQFFVNFSVERRTELKDRFISLWEKLGTIYHRYRASLEEKDMAYEGMLYRDAVSHINAESAESLANHTYVFVGFNVLNKVEHQLFKRIQEYGKAMFYWDYDSYYTQFTEQKHEAGEFIRRNLSEFPNELPEEIFHNFHKPKTIRYISTPTENAQARFLPEWIRTTLSGPEKENAIVLCNEALLLPVLHSIPDQIENVNITMGFPLAQTPIYQFIKSVVHLQTAGYKTDDGRYQFDAVRAVLKHPYTQLLSEKAKSLEKELTEKNRFYPLPSELKRDAFLTKLFTPVKITIVDLCNYITDLLTDISVLYRSTSEQDDIFNQLYREALFKSYLTVNRLSSLAENGELEVRIDTFNQLLNTILSGINIPFHGEPAIGLQIMGVLETRNLDFRNLVMLSLNEGLLPKAGGDSSFVPYNLRKAFGMTTIDHKNAVYAYYFYRLIQRAENITLMYNTASDGLNRGEWSRFMLQLLLESPHQIQREYLEAGQSPQNKAEISIRKSDTVLERLNQTYNHLVNSKASLLSPSALNTYLDCRLKFYFHYVANLKAPNEVSAEIDSAQFGTIFHQAAEWLYDELTVHNKVVNKDDLERLLKDPMKLRNYVDRAFKEHLFKVPQDEKPEYNGIQLINSEVILSYLKQLIRNDIRYAPFTLRGMEKKVEEWTTIQVDGQTIQLKLGGTIDRMDIKDGILRIVDYKTGGTPKTLANLNDLFISSEKRANYIFQTFLYAAIVCRQESLKVAPSLLYIHRAAADDYSPVIEMGEPRQPKVPIDNFALIEDEFRAELEKLLQEIFGKDELFDQTQELKKCEYCDYKGICKR